ncbi:MAG: alcohol dehydrogenase catalytic domain-containing protein [Acidobacteriota bacterium]
MKAVVFDKELKVVEHAKPHSTSSEALIHLTLAGICNTDLEITRGYFGFQGVLGHEFVGVVESASDSRLVGKRVVGEINAACGSCAYCRRHMGRHCPHRTVLGILGRDGAFREYLTLPQTNLHIVPDSIGDDQAVFTEPVAAACEILDQVEIGPSRQVAVLGDGKLGLLIAMVLAGTGARLTILGKHEEKLSLVSHLGVTAMKIENSRDLTRDFDVVVEATGSPAGWEQALLLIKPRGTIVLKSTYQGQGSFNPARLVVDEITVVGSRCGRFEAALDLLSRGRIDPAKLIQHRLRLEEAPRAFELAQQPGVLKVVLEP